MSEGHARDPKCPAVWRFPHQSKGAWPEWVYAYKPVKNENGMKVKVEERNTEMSDFILMSVSDFYRMFLLFLQINERRILNGIFTICGVPSTKFETACSTLDKLGKVNS